MKRSVPCCDRTDKPKFLLEDAETARQAVHLLRMEHCLGDPSELAVD